ncbi:MAG TPA: MFS transporter [Candidatus Nanoarchaeia archaeon]|nr:MFS transporter [Candidatus Nanoarchaeia archaeon]
MIHHHEFWWRFFPKKELTQIYLSVALRGLAISMLGLFIPLYLYREIGISLNDTLIFFIFYSVIFGIFTPLAAKFAARYGTKHTVLLSVPLYLAFIICLHLLSNYSVPLILVSLTLGLSQAFYWMGINLAFHHASDHQHRGEEVGKEKAASIIATIIGPLTGGFLITFFGFPIVFLLTSLLLITATFILFISGENHVRYRFSVRSVINKHNWKDSIFFVSRGTEVIAKGVIWPLFIFLTLKSYISLGLVGSLLSVISAFLLLSVGKFSDHRDKRKIVKLVSGFETISWLLRAMAFSVGYIYGATVFGGITDGVRESPLGALEYDKAKGDIVGYFVSREVFICLGRILLLSLAIMTSSLAGSLVSQGFFSLAALLF